MYFWLAEKRGKKKRERERERERERASHRCSNVATSGDRAVELRRKTRKKVKF